jgi:hypothetical protein
MTGTVEEDYPVCNSSTSAKEQFAGPTWQNLGILLATGVLIGLETTAYDEPSATSTS